LIGVKAGVVPGFFIARLSKKILLRIIENQKINSVTNN